VRSYVRPDRRSTRRSASRRSDQRFMIVSGF
jgi:hypothetical protein